jgi:glycosyltransferase involved in cell wall biosynthesis
LSATIAAIVPTRNRPRYAMDAVRSLLDQDVPIHIYVSDNSTSADALRDFCRDKPRVTYLRPARELPMGENWDWAIRQAMEQSSATHFTVHYDRRISKPGTWGGLAAKAARFPDDLFTFSVDQVASIPPPLRLWQACWTGKLFSIRCAHVAGLIARGLVVQVSNALPVLSNCLVPRSIFEGLLDRFGNICDSTAPDCAFMVRFLALHDRYLHFDRAMGILYGSRRSNGLGYLRNKGGDFPDFMRFSGSDYLHAAPVPGISIGCNMLFHEYELARRTVGDRLPPLDRAAALQELGSELRWIAEPGRKAELRHILQEHGWKGPEPRTFPKREWRHIRDELRCRYHMKRRGYVPPTITGFAFLTDRRALKYGLLYPRERQDGHEHLAPLEPVEMGR